MTFDEDFKTPLTEREKQLGDNVLKAMEHISEYFDKEDFPPFVCVQALLIQAECGILFGKNVKAIDDDLIEAIRKLSRENAFKIIAGNTKLKLIFPKEND